jgi:phage gpG-like protein
MDKFNFDVILKRMERMKSDLPVRLANQAQNFFVASFDKQGWDNGSVTPWAPRKGKVTNKPILVKTGALRRAVSTSIRNATFESVKLVIALPYAAIQNYGGTINKGSREAVLHFNKQGKFAKAKFNKNYSHSGNVTIGAHTIGIPARQFVGDSATLRVQQKTKIISEINKAWHP